MKIENVLLIVAPVASSVFVNLVSFERMPVVGLLLGGLPLGYGVLDYIGQVKCCVRV